MHLRIADLETSTLDVNMDNIVPRENIASRHRNLSFAVAVLVLSLMACNFFANLLPVPDHTPTPDLTRTAIVGILQGLPTSTTIPADNGSGVKIPEPTITLASTSTPTPIVLQGDTGMRSGPSIVAVYVENPPKINGDLSDWNMNIYPSSYPVYGDGLIGDEADLSSNVMVGWDEDFMYIGARVKDDIYVQNAAGKDLYKGDSIEIVLDTEIEKDSQDDTLSFDDYQLGVSPGLDAKGTNAEAYLWYPSIVQGSRSQVQIGVMDAADGYHIEIAIPWLIFGVSPSSGQHFGFAFSVSDNDLVGQSEQQSMISTIGTRRLTNPMSWGDLTLEE